jgi:hypothetical protein
MHRVWVIQSFGLELADSFFLPLLWYTKMYDRLALQNAYLMALRHLLVLLDAHIAVATRSVLVAGHVAPMHGALRALRYVLEEANVDDVLANGSEGVALLSRMLIAFVMCLAVPRSGRCATLRADDVMVWQDAISVCDATGRSEI